MPSGKSYRMQFTSYMDRALAQARLAAGRGEVPVGAVVVGPDGTVLAEAGNENRKTQDPTAHAEVQAIRRAAQTLGHDRLEGCVLYVTLEPCAMCAGAISQARIVRVVYGAADPKSGGTDHGARVFDHPQCHHKPEVIGGIAEVACKKLLTDFFAAKRPQ